MIHYACLIIALCALSLRSVAAVRYGQHAMIMAPDHTVEPAVDPVDDDTKQLLEDSEQIEKAMQEEIGLINDDSIAEMCLGSKDEHHCASQIAAYVARCKEGNCLTIDAVGKPQNKAYKQLVLPDPYQLHAAFLLFKNCRRNESRHWMDRFWMRFKRGGRYAAYYSFSLNLLRRNLFLGDDENALHGFVQKYFYMTAIYYKTYLSLDAINAKIFNKIALAKHILGPKIKRALRKIVEANKPSALQANDVKAIRPLAYGYRQYMASQIPSLPFFAYRFSSMVVTALVDNLTGVKQQPWYKRWFGKVKNLFTGKQPSEKAYEIDEPIATEEETEPVEENKSVFGKVKEKLGNIRFNTGIFRKGEAKTRHSHLSEEDIMGSLSSADALLEPVLDVMEKEGEAQNEEAGEPEVAAAPKAPESENGELADQVDGASTVASTEMGEEESLEAPKGTQDLMHEDEEQEPESDELPAKRKRKASSTGYKKFFKNILDTGAIKDAASRIGFPKRYFKRSS
uniref:Rhoptry-associated protein 1c n=1 Tax=Babesia bigemina TaxID=5866 RepID=A0A6C0QED8_BABBI|nr:rhoptry-associated protein 1c [Babesia bigemina]